MAQVTASPAIQLCLFCSKPFTAASSYKRHLSYCRRNKDRLHRRSTSCRNCRLAKAKCTFEAPCGRCASRKLDCTYDHTSTNDVVYDVFQDGSETSATESFPTFFDLDNHDLVALADLEQPPPKTFGGLRLDDNEMDVFSLISQPNPHRDLNPLQHTAISNVPSDRLNCTANTGFLTRLRKTNPVAKHSANLIIDALCAIPEQMLRPATFPPFIHPHWHRQKLPEPLVVCMRIAQMFALRTPDVKPFLWRTILTEQRRVVEQACQLSKEDVLAAMQAHIVYLTMRVIDGVMESSEWDREMATSHTVVCDRFLELCNGRFCEDEQKMPSLTWDDWVFAESRRRQVTVQSRIGLRERWTDGLSNRTSCVWFLMTRVISVKTTEQCSTILQTPWVLPLPSQKLQWEARDNDTWQQEIMTNTPAITTLGALVESKKRCTDPSHAQRLDSWNARSDNLGALMNIATAML